MAHQLDEGEKLTASPGDQPGLRDRLRAALVDAMLARDRVVVAALRSALAAIDNAGAVEVAAVPHLRSADQHVAGSVGGLGAAEAERRTLSEAEMVAVVRAEVDDRLTSVETYERSGQPQRAGVLRAEADAILGHLGDLPA